jgi:acyl carrier protein
MDTIDKNEILEKIRDIVQDALRKNLDLIVPDARLFLDLGAESLDILDIRFRMEQEFNIKITDGDIIKRFGKNATRDEIENKLTVQSLVDYMSVRLIENVRVS